MTRIEILQKTGLNIFTLEDLISLWQVESTREIVESVKDYIRRKRLFRLHRGVYALSSEFDSRELAQKLITPSYISFLSALSVHGVIFQHYEELHSVCLCSKKYKIGNQEFIYHKLPASIFYNELGIVREKNFTIASPERAICDSLYLNKRVVFDNLKMVNRELVLQISKIYKNKRLERGIDTDVK